MRWHTGQLLRKNRISVFLPLAYSTRCIVPSRRAAENGSTTSPGRSGAAEAAGAGAGDGGGAGEAAHPGEARVTATVVAAAKASEDERIDVMSRPSRVRVSIVVSSG